MDISNPVIKYCMDGSKAELEKNLIEAELFYKKSWEISGDNYDKSVAEHYVARVQKNIQDIFKWNEIALTHAELSNSQDVKEIYPSLYLNMGNSCEDIKDYKKALDYYNLDIKSIKDSSEGSLGEMIKNKFQEKINRINSNQLY